MHERMHGKDPNFLRHDSKDQYDGLGMTLKYAD
jgi:hypothetical protein